MSVPSDNQGDTGRYNPPKSKKRYPLSHSDTREFYRTACSFPDREIELIGRVLLDYGLRVDELCHSRSHWINKEYNKENETEQWRILIPKTESCWGGTGGEAGQKNEAGADLHNTNQPCTRCVDRNWQGKIEPLNTETGDREPENGWLTWDQAEKYDFAAKSEKSASKVWQLGDIEESVETARMLKEYLEQQPHKQWPHGQNAVRNRVDKICEVADLDLNDRPQDRIVPHALRHTYGCRLVEMGVSEGIGMQLMRHSNSDVFQWYSQVRGGRVQAALKEASSESDSLL